MPNQTVASAQTKAIFPLTGDLVLAGVVVLLVVGLLIVLVYRYRDTPDNKAPYDPASTRKVMKYMWLAIPFLILGILSTFS